MNEFLPTFMHDLASQLVKDGAEIHCIAPHDANTKNHEFMEGVEVSRFNYFYPKKLQKLCYGAGIPANMEKIFLAKIQMPFFILSLFFKSVIYVRKYDIIHCLWPIPGIVGVILKYLTGKPLILTLQGYGINNAKVTGIQGMLMKWVLTNCNYIITVNKTMIEKVQLYGVPHENLVFIPNGVDAKKFKLKKVKKNGYKLLSIGAFVPKKGQIFLIEAMAEVVKKYPQTVLTLVGDGPLRFELTEKAKSLGLQDNIYFPGTILHDKIPLLFEESDLFVLSSLAEGMPLVLIEAMACGLPQVATSVDGIPDIALDGETSILVPPKDPQSLSNAIIKLLDDDELIRKYGEKSRERVLNGFTWSDISSETMNVYQKALKD